MTTIGFFGDSFCAEVSNHHSLLNGYKSYMKLLSEHYNAEVVNVGHGGCSVWDTLLIQLNPFIKSNTVPDICVFVWTIPGRLFSRKIRRLNSTDVKHKLRLSHRQVWQAAEMFYDHLYDQEKEYLEYVSALRYIDQVVLPQLPATTKIIHLWTAGNTAEWSREGARPVAITYPHSWTTGMEIRPSLLSVSLYDNDISVLKSDHRCNHLDGQFKNDLVFNWIVKAIDMTHGLDYSTEVDKLYYKSPEADPPAT